MKAKPFERVGMMELAYSTGHCIRCLDADSVYIHTQTCIQMKTNEYHHITTPSLRHIITTKATSSTLTLKYFVSIFKLKIFIFGKLDFFQPIKFHFHMKWSLNQLFT
jgi:hypothetical protein